MCKEFLMATGHAAVPGVGQPARASCASSKVRALLRFYRLNLATGCMLSEIPVLCTLLPLRKPGHDAKKYASTMARLDNVMASTNVLENIMSFVLRSKIKAENNTHQRGCKFL